MAISQMPSETWVCLRTDTKPTTQEAAQALGFPFLRNGQPILEEDTGAVYVFDADSSTWKAL